MKTKIKDIIKTSKEHLIKVQLDYKTLVYVKNKESLKMWLEKYPDAKVIG